MFSSLFKNKSKKNGPLKALTSMFSSEDSRGDRAQNAASHGSPLSVVKNSDSHSSKDDLSVLTREAGKKKNKMKTNPYATTKMWRPITMTSSVSQKEDVFHNFTNFDVLTGDAPRLPATGDLRNEQFSSSVTSSSSPHLAQEAQEVSVGDTLPPDYHIHPSPETVVRSASYSEEKSHAPKKQLKSTRSAPPAPLVPNSGAVVKRTATRSSSSSTVTIPLKSRSLSVEEEMQGTQMFGTAQHRSRSATRSSRDTPPFSALNGGGDLPEDYPRDSSSSASSQRSRSLSAGSRGRRESMERRGRSVMDSSYDVVSMEVATSVRNVLSNAYGPEGFELASQDVENLLDRLKDTMERLKMLQAGVSSSVSQFQTVKQELQLQAKQFVQDAKHLVAGANGQRQAISGQLDTAMHTLARLLLHSQATMVRMESVHQAQHMGFEVMKVAASFKSTMIAANAAIGKPTTDPHMKYLMRQATNLAGLLSTLLKALKNLEQTQ